MRGQVHTQGIESHWATLKRGINGVYHHVSPKHLDRYAMEFEGRHNARPLDTKDQITRLIYLVVVSYHARTFMHRAITSPFRMNSHALLTLSIRSMASAWMRMGPSHPSIQTKNSFIALAFLPCPYVQGKQGPSRCW